MNFKTYDILSALVPGFIVLVALLNFANIRFDKDMVLVYTAFAFLLGYVINATASWLEDFYYITWGGKPSSMLLEGKNIWKVSFHYAETAKKLLQKECNDPHADNDKLFGLAMRYANVKDTRTDDFNAAYAFSRSILTTALFAFLLLIPRYYCDWHFYILSIPLIFICWLRAKQRGYYYAKEVLTIYLKDTKTTLP